ncbi:MFS transporter [Candidatus Shapirobacteria bacterium]|nr:MFS transporter [Candidatus Shapirobacteria bacterium]
MTMDFSRNIRLLTWQGFFIGFSLWSPIAAIYFSQVSGSFAWGLSIFSVANISGAIFEIPTGVFSDFSDKIGRKYTTMLGGLAYTLSGVAYAIGLNFWWLVLGAILGGLGRSFYSGNNDAYLYDSLNKSDKKEELAKFMGKIGSAEQWALGAAAILGGMLAAISFKLVMWLSVIPLLLCFVTSWWLIDIKNKKGEEGGNVYSHLSEAIKNFLGNKKLRLLSLSSIVGFGIGEAGFHFRSLFVLSLWPLWAIGVARMLSNIGAAIGFGWSGKIVEKFKAERVLMFEQISSKLIDLVALLWPTPLSPVLMSTTSIMYGPSTVAENSIFQNEFTDKQRATMGSLNSLGRSISLAIFIYGLGWVADKTDPRIALLCGWTLGLVSVWLTWKLMQMVRKEG